MKSKFIGSFRMFDRRFVYVALSDLAFYAVLAVVAVFVLKLLAWSSASLMQIPLEMLDIQSAEDFSGFEQAMLQTGELLAAFKSKMLLTLVLCWVLLVFSFTLFKGIAWGLVKKQKLNRKYFIQFLKLNIAWFAGIAVVVFLIFLIANPIGTGLLVNLVFSIALYLVPISYALFRPDVLLKEHFRKVSYVGIAKFYHFIIPSIISSLILILILVVFSTLALFAPVPCYVLLFLFAVLWSSWLKYYIYLVARGVR